MPSQPTGNPRRLSRREAIVAPVTAALAAAVGLHAAGQLVFVEPAREVVLAPNARTVETRFEIVNPSAFGVTIVDIQPESRGLTATLEPPRRTVRPGERRELVVTAPATGARREPQQHAIRVTTDQRLDPETTLALTVATEGWAERKAQQDAAHARREALLQQLEITPATLAWTVGQTPEPQRITVRRRAADTLPDLHLEAFALPDAVLERRRRALAERAAAAAPDGADAPTPLIPWRGRASFGPDRFEVDVRPAPDAGWTVTVTPRSLDLPARSVVRLVAYPDGKPPSHDDAPIAKGGTLLAIPVAVRPAERPAATPDAAPDTESQP
ncbi:MAG: hypothetical protein AAGI54_03840 [Planctomycetota bacterium]